MCPSIERSASSGGGDWPKPGRSTAWPSTVPASPAISSSQLRVDPPRPWTKSAGGSPDRRGGWASAYSGLPGARTWYRTSPPVVVSASNVSRSPLMGTMLRGRCRVGTGSLMPTSPTTPREATMSEVNDAALDSLDDAEGDERPEVEAEGEDDGEELE